MAAGGFCVVGEGDARRWSGVLSGQRKKNVGGAMLIILREGGSVR